MAFASSDLRSPGIRRLWALAVLAVLILDAVIFSSEHIEPLDKAGLLVASVFLVWRGFSAITPRTACYYLAPDSLVAVFCGIRLFKVPYADIEYSGYTAENAFLGGARYLPFGGGILCLITRPGFLVTIDFARSRVVKAGRLIRVPAKRVLITLDDPRGFMQQLRQHLG